MLTSVAPYHLRGLTGAVGAIYLFFIGALGGAILSAGLDQAFGPRAALLIVMIPATTIGGLMIIRGSHFIRNDLSLVVARAPGGAGGAPAPGWPTNPFPAIQLNNVDFSYGHVQVLFDVAFEVRARRGPRPLGHQRRGQSRRRCASRPGS